MKQLTEVKRKTVIFAGIAICLVLLIVSLYFYHREYIPWNNVGLAYTFAALSCLSFCGLSAFTVLSKKQSVPGIIIRTFIATLVYVLLLFVLTFLLNNVLGQNGHLDSIITVMPSNQFAITVTYVVLGVMTAIVLSIFLKNSLKTKIVPLLQAILVIIPCVYGVVQLNSILPVAEKLYPAYRIFVSQGGTKTEDKHIFYDFAYSTEKLQPFDNLSKDTEMSISLAKNEREAFQFAVYSDKKDKKISISCTDFQNGQGESIPVRIFSERYVDVPQYGRNIFTDKYPDGLIPVASDNSTELIKDELLIFYIEAVSSKETSAGEYSATLKLYDEDDNEILSKEIKAEVWNFVLEEEYFSESAMGLSSGVFWELMGYDASGYGGNGALRDALADERQQIYEQYYNFLLDHHISAYVLPYDILDERADAYMSNPAVKSFQIPYTEDAELLKKYYDKVSSNEEWAKKAFFYPIDEPQNAEQYDRYNEITAFLSENCAGYNMVTPFFVADVEINGNTYSSVSLQSGKSSILCPISNIFDEGDFNERIYSSLSENEGSKLWWYVCCGPTGDYNNLFTHQDAIRHRILFWQQYQRDVEGFLYWDSIYCDKGNPWETSKTWETYESAGDGCLIYPGKYMGIDEPVATLRLKNVADGIEDYAYLRLCEEIKGSEWVEQKIAEITDSLTSYTDDDVLLQNIRKELAKAICEEQK